MTSLDLFGAIGLTASASTVIGSLAGYDSASARSRVRFGLSLAGWFVLIVICGAAGTFDYRAGLGTPGLGIAVLLPVLALVYAATRLRGLHALLQAVPVGLLVGVHTVRLLGVFLVLLYLADRLPAPFAPIAGWGDIAVGATAVPLAWAALKQTAGWRPVILFWNSLGLLDLLVAIGLGITSAEGSPLRLFHAEPSTLPMSSLPWVLVPAFLVPLLLSIHLAIYYRLASPRRAGGLAHP